MADSSFVYLNGEPVDVGNAVENDFVFAGGQLVSDGDESAFAFVEDRGIGGQPEADRVFTMKEDSAGVVEAFDASDGSLLWETTHFSDNVLAGSLAPDESVVYAGGQDNTIGALAPSDGSLQWRETVDGSSVWSVVPGPDGNALYVGTANGGYALDPTDRSELWSTTLSERCRELIAAPDGSTVYGGFGDGTLRAFDASDGTEQWSFAGYGAELYAAIPASSGAVFGGSADGTVRRHDPVDGTEQWSVSPFGAANDRATVAPTPSGDAVYAGGSFYVLKKLDASDGSQIWSTNIFDFANPLSATAGPGDAAVYADGENNTLRKLDASDGSQIWSTYHSGGFSTRHVITRPNAIYGPK